MALTTEPWGDHKQPVGDRATPNRKRNHLKDNVIPMEIITRSFTTVHGEPASLWQIRLTGDDVLNAGQITHTAAGYVVERTGGRRDTYRSAARAAQAMRDHIADRWPDELTASSPKENGTVAAVPTRTDEAEALADADAALDALRESREVASMVEMLTSVYHRTEATGTWQSPLGRAIEYALGHLRLALEAPALAHPGDHEAA